MLPEPLHPAVVHFPIALAVLLPIAALVALLVIRRGSSARAIWLVPVALTVALAGSAWVALETGEAEEDRVEALVAESAIHDHEEAAERFLALSAVLAVVATAGLLSGTAGKAARLVATAGTLVVLVAGVQVGSAGGKLVYEHGAAQAYLTGAQVTASDASGESEVDDDEHERRTP